MQENFNIPPDAVKVWRGYKASNLQLKDFLDKLGTVFVPATVEMQIAAGLCAYVPAIPAGLPNKPAGVPDETAILFWESQQTYTDAFKTLAVRTYTLTHGPVYQKPSTATFPIAFTGTVKADQAYYLIDRPADWMHGKVSHIVGGRPAAQTQEAFLAQIAKVLSGIQQQAKVAGAVACAGDDYLVYWELGGDGSSSGIGALKPCLGWSQVFAPAANRLPAGLWDDWPGMTISSGDSFNMQFVRRWEHLDQKLRPVAPDSVHVWRGYRLPGMSYDDFRAYLGSVFVPSASLLQPGAGLYAYVPSMIPSGTAGTMPDQTALLFWADQQTRVDSYGMVGERAYKSLHSQAYAEPPSVTGYPAPFSGTVAAEQPYYLFDGPADWMYGAVRHFVGAAPTGQSSADFLKAVAQWTLAYRKAPPAHVDAAIICAGNGYVAFWEHAVAGAPNDEQSLASLAKIATPALSKTAETYVLPSGLWNQWPGIDLSVYTCINVQLDRESYKPLPPAA